MPVLETADDITPRSVLRHRPVRDTASSTGRRFVAAPVMQRASRSATPDTDDVSDWQQGDEIDTRPGTQSGVRRTTVTGKVYTPAPYPKTTVPHRPRQQAHPLLYLGVGMLVMLLLWTALSAAFGWFTTILDDIHYGYPRTYQVDAWVGHEQTGSPSHFIAINLHGHIEIIEMPGGDAAHARIYVGPQLFGANSDLVPVTLDFVDVNGDQNPDMIVNFQGSRVVFINDKGKGAFRMALPSERSAIEQVLQRLGK